MPVVRNSQFYFKEGFCWNNVLTTYIRCREKQKTIQSTESMSLFSMVNKVPEYYIISIMNSSYAAYYIDSFVNSTSHCTTGDAKLLPIMIPTNEQLILCKTLYDKVIALKKSITDKSSINEIKEELYFIETCIDNFVNQLYSI